eukprot:CAMPEP_0173170840 /NCGR_PEP_ID=MMETSP1141-20130122/1440_1 /TAXON_ID=483371 /ORGANISM="non described non described, Strain CCMP2298" /LENGTH=133 /DNA_ID=CAMNT_0014092737 /DNA_START=57 /DNA_END=454 /DNA_ORIENTATION=+
MTIRIGRSFCGAYRLIEGELAAGKSVLLVGCPGAGKTTFVRDCARFLAQTRRVEIVDASNEIAGEGDVPHWSVGRARRMMVKQGKHGAMLEAVQNHTPQVLVVDEIGAAEEVAAARDIAQRGVQLLATAHAAR